MENRMSSATSTSSGAARGRYIIRSKHEQQPLADFLGVVSNDPAIAVVDTIGPVDKPHTVVAEMSQDTASSLERQFLHNDQLTIEPDQPLSLFPSP
jgi:rRNA processing protein Gar1